MPSKQYAGDVGVFGVALRQTRPGWRHAGLVVRASEKDKLRLLHLADHYCFQNEELTERYTIYSNSNFNLGELEYLSERALRLWDVNGAKIAYGLDYDGSQAFDTGMKFVGSAGRGLTCSTFVLAFLARCGFPVVDTESWLPRSDDEVFQSAIFAHLRTRLDGEQAKRMEDAVGNAARFRPEEVVACFSHYDDSPFSFNAAKRWGREVLNEAGMV